MICFDSKKVKKGDTFVAIRGLNFDGHDFIDQAFKKGAKKVYGEKNIKVYGGKYEKVNDSRKKLAEIASKFYKNPSNKLNIIGVTGTKGKTTTVHMIAHVLNLNGFKTDIISSISVKDFHVTSPDIVTLNKYLAEMVNKKMKYVVLEVSSHGIDQRRVEGINFDITVLTNIKPEHLDYHKTFKEYKKIKTEWFKKGRIQVKSPDSTKINIFPGDFNNINAETAVLVAEKLGIQREKSIENLANFKLPEGRMEEIKNNLGVRIFVDFAHTPDSLEKALLYLKSLKPKKPARRQARLISVFGCAGERDTTKRSKMARISTKIADLSVFTAEDPRSETVFNILKLMKKGATNKNFVSISERGEAIAFAVKQSKKGDIVAIFGKGHEKTMCYKDFEHPWSDQQFIKSFLNKEEGTTGVLLAAGKGTRMKSALPKVLHQICGRSMISFSLENFRNAGIWEIIPVVGYKRNLVKKYFSGIENLAVQEKTLGTGHALATALPFVAKNSSYVLVANGDDSAFYSQEIIRDLLNYHKNKKAVISFVSLTVKDPYGLGRLVRDEKGRLCGIVEEKDATKKEREINEINYGMYVFDKNWLLKNIKKINKNNISSEYYIVDLIKIAIREKSKIFVYKLTDSSFWQGVNTKEQLQDAERKMKEKIGYEEK